MDRSDSPSWTAAKAHGDDAELRVLEWFRRRGFDVTKTVGNDTYDLLALTKLEVKNDLKAATTGNVAVEVSHRGKPSGIMATSADRYITVVENTAYMALTPQLRSLIQSGNFREIPAGDGGLARIMLVPLDMFRALDFVHPFTLSERKR